MSIRKIRFIDSHTAGEPTRVVIAGGPELPAGTAAQKLAALQAEHDAFRSGAVNEPRGSDVLVGALLAEPSDSTCAAAVIFFNNVGYLGMCGHGTIGLAATLAYMGRIAPGVHRIETPVGIVTATLHETGAVSVDNVPSYRLAKGVAVEVEGYGTVTGDIAWGGNWFFLVSGSIEDLHVSRAEELTDITWRIRKALAAAGVAGRDGAEIDHIELFAPSDEFDSTNFVLCPGKAYDRSPCGTGTSAKLACLYADGKLAAGQVWRQGSIIGSSFEGKIRTEGDMLIPTITGRAYVTAEGALIFENGDPLRDGIVPSYSRNGKD